MPTTTRTFRVFVSSTFEDLKEERNALQREVFPKLTKLCEEHGARFQAIDLRWGVREEAGLDQKTMEICLAEIERCKKTKLKPNFIVMLGDRYGWQPLAARIEVGEFERVRNAIGDSAKRALFEMWYQRDDNAVPPEYLLKPRTGEFVDPYRWREVESALRPALREAARATRLAADDLIKYEASATHQEILKGLGKEPEDRQHVFAFFRNGTEDEDTDLQKLKEDLKGQLRENVFSFDAGDYGELCKRVTESLEKVILGEAERFESRPALDLEIEAHDTFAKDRSKHFVGRRSALDGIDDYLKSNDRLPLVILGASGSGKSAIMAKASGAQGVVRRFIGATPESSNGLTLLRSLCQEIARRYGQPEDVPATFNELAVAFKDRVGLATADRPLIIYIDALDQLAAQDPAAAMNWLPAELPPHCKVVVSTIRVPSALQRARLLAIEPFRVEEADQALALWLEEGNRTLQPQQRQTLLVNFGSTPLPLYLKLAFEEARRWRSFDLLEQCVLGEGLTGIVDRLFSRLAEESNHGGVLVGHAVGYLTAARYGLTEDEILAVLSDDDEVWKDFSIRARHEPPERRLPVIVWSRLHLDLEPYLTERAAPGGAVISFYHRQLAERVSANTFNHSGLANYFAGQPLWLGPQRPNERRATELVRQQVKAELLDNAAGTLTDIGYLEVKCAAELVFDLQEDYREVMMALPEAQAELREVSSTRSLLARWTQTLMDCARQRRLPKPEEIIPSIQPWADEPIAAELEGISENLVRLDLLKAFSGFVDQETYPLLEFGKYSGFVAQHAYNHSPAGPVHERGHAEVGVLGAVMLLRCWPKGALPGQRRTPRRTLEGHAREVMSVSVTPDGRRAVSAGSFDNTLRVWDLETGQCLRALEGHTNSVQTVSLSLDGRRAVSGSTDKTLRVWDLETGQCLHTLSGHTDAVGSVSVTSDARRIVSSSGKTLWVWDLETGTCLHVLQGEGHGSTVDCVSVTLDGRRAVSGSFDSTLRVWDIEKGACLLTLKDSFNPVTSVSLMADGRRAVSGGHNKTLSVWDIEKGACLYTLGDRFSSSITSVSVTPDGRRAVSGGDDRTLWLWDLEARTCVRRLWGHTDTVRSVSISPDGRSAVSGGDDKTLRVWDLESGQYPDMNTMEGHRNLESHGNKIYSVSVTPDGRRAVSGGEDQRLRVWDLETGACLHKLWGHTDTVRSVSIAPDGRSAVSASGGGFENNLRVWDLGTGSCLRALSGHTDRVQSVNVTPDRQRAVSGSWDKTIRVWDLETGQCLRTLQGHTHYVESVSVTPDGRQAVSGSWDKTIRVWDLRTGQCLRTLEGHNHEVYSVNVTRDGRKVVSGSWDKTIRVWDLETGQCLRTLEVRTGVDISVSVTPDGRRAVSGSEDQTLRVWDLETGACLAIARLNEPCHAVDATPDRIVAGTSTGEILFFEVRGLQL